MNKKINKAGSSHWIIRLEMKKENWDRKFCAHAWAYVVVLLPTRQVKVGRQLVSFRESKTRRKNMKTSVEHEQRRRKKTQVYETLLGGALQWGALAYTLPSKQRGKKIQGLYLLLLYYDYMLFILSTEAAVSLLFCLYFSRWLFTSV